MVGPSPPCVPPPRKYNAVTKTRSRAWDANSGGRRWRRWHGMVGFGGLRGRFHWEFIGLKGISLGFDWISRDLTEFEWNLVGLKGI